MTMNAREVGEFLKRLNAYDGRKIDDIGVFAAWMEAAAVGRWSYAEACAAAAEFYAMPADPNRRRFLEPGNITYLVRMRKPSTTAVAELTVGRRSTAEHRAAVRAELDAQLAPRLAGRRTRRGREPWHDGPVQRALEAPAAATPASARAALAKFTRDRTP